MYKRTCFSLASKWSKTSRNAKKFFPFERDLRKYFQLFKGKNHSFLNMLRKNPKDGKFQFFFKDPFPLGRISFILSELALFYFLIISPVSGALKAKLFLKKMTC